MNKIVVYKNRLNTVPCSLGFDVSDDTITSEIRSEPDSNSVLIAAWDVTYETDGVDGEIVLTMNPIDTTAESGYMDIKRVTGGNAVPVFDRPLEVDFRGTVTL